MSVPSLIGVYTDRYLDDIDKIHSHELVQAINAFNSPDGQFAKVDKNAVVPGKVFYWYFKLDKAWDDKADTFVELARRAFDKTGLKTEIFGIMSINDFHLL